MQYEEHHKRRLSLKPGITGMWQVSGRSEIQNFEDVVKLDLEYIDKAVDELCEKGTVDAEDVFAQIGYSDYLPKNFNYKKFLDRDEFSAEMSKAEIGRLGQRKGTYDLIDAIDIARKSVPNIKCYLAGDGDIEKVKDLVKTRKLEKNIEVVGWADFDKKLELLSSVSTVVLPSYNEGLPMSILEGMACGKAIVSTTVGAIPEVINKENGILVEAGDVKALSEALVECSQDIEIIKKMSISIMVTKTLQRFKKMKKDERFITFFESPIVVNGKRYLPLNEIIISLEQAIPEMLYDVDTFNIIHGDLCFANIMVDSNFSFIKVIDPRGKFGTYDIYGDFRYELAKLFHSVDGKYDFIIKDLFDLDYNSEAACINYRIQDRKREFDLYKVFLSTFATEIDSDLKKIELIEALLFLSMIPLHGESIRHQMVMLGTGLEILNRVIDIQIGEKKNV